MSTDIQAQLEKRLAEKGATFEILTHEPVLTMADVERVLGVSLDQTAKTLVVKVADQIYLVAIPGDARLDKRKLAMLLGISRKHIDLLSAAAVEESIGLPLGAIPPFHPDHPVVMDAKLLGLSKLYCGCGSHTASLVVNPVELRTINAAVAGDIIA